MVTFSHEDAGTPAELWEQHGRHALPGLPEELTFGSGQHVVVVVAHPDDETLGAGGLIRRALVSGADVTVIVATNGEASHPDSPTHSGADLGRIRQRELAAALRLLQPHHDHAGQANWSFLELPDGRLGTAKDQLNEKIREILQLNTSVLISTYRHDGHGDHEALGQVAAAIAAERGLPLLEFPLWYWHWAHPERDERWRHWFRLELEPDELAVKTAASAEHASQVTALSAASGDEQLLSDGFLAHFQQPYEVFRYTPAGLKDSATATETFEALYREHRDPWNYVDSPYEQRKRTITMASLQRAHYPSVLELGCSIGISTAEFAQRADAVLAVDASSAALQRARENTRRLENVSFFEGTLPTQWPDVPAQSQDLIVISEIGYYLAADELTQVLRRVAEVLRPGGELLICHWLHRVEGWALTGEKVHQIVRNLGWPVLVQHRERDFLLEIYQRPSTVTAMGDHDH